MGILKSVILVVSEEFGNVHTYIQIYKRIYKQIYKQIYRGAYAINNMDGILPFQFNSF